MKAVFFRQWTRWAGRVADAAIVPSLATESRGRRACARATRPGVRRAARGGPRPVRQAFPDGGPRGTRVAGDRRGLAVRRLPRHPRAAQERAGLGACIRTGVRGSTGSAGAGDRGRPRLGRQHRTPPSRAVPSHLRVLRPGFVPDGLVPALLGGADVVAYPAFGEGFGLPVLEAMACGAPVLTTRRLSLPEVGGDAVAYADSPAADDVAAALAALLDDPERRSRLREAGIQRAARFTWLAAAEAHVDVYEKVATDDDRRRRASDRCRHLLPRPSPRVVPRFGRHRLRVPFSPSPSSTTGPWTGPSTWSARHPRGRPHRDRRERRVRCGRQRGRVRLGRGVDPGGEPGHPVRAGCRRRADGRRRSLAPRRSSGAADPYDGRSPLPFGARAAVARAGDRTRTLRMGLAGQPVDCCVPSRARRPVEGTVGWLSGACLLLRREAFDGVGGFDEAYFMYFEDTDLCPRLATAGWDVVYAPSAVVEHQGGHSTESRADAMSREHHRSAYRYLSRRYSGPAWAPVRAVLRVGLWSRYQLGRRVARITHGAQPTRQA